MELNETQKAKIEPKVIRLRCPMCSSRAFSYYDETEKVFTQVHDGDYLIGECQACGFTTLFRLSILLGEQSK